MRLASLLIVACVTLTGCGAAGVAAPPRALMSAQAEGLTTKGDAAKLTSAQVRAALGLIGEKLYGKDFTYDFQHNDAAISLNGHNRQGNLDWLVVREFRAAEKAGQYTFLATEYTKEDSGVMQSQYKLTGVVDLKANAVVDLRKEVEDRDPR